MKRFRFLDFFLLLTLAMTTIVFKSCEEGYVSNSNGGSSATDKGVMINGVKWATRNVDNPGTFTANPEDAGMFYQWNRKVAYAATGSASNWDKSNPTGNAWEKANDPCSAGWRVPTRNEIQTLNSENVSHEWTSVDGINGRRFIDKASGNSIFLPAAGYRDFEYGGALDEVGLVGGYWSSTRFDGDTAEGLAFDSDRADWEDFYRKYGLNVRCVAEQ